MEKTVKEYSSVKLRAIITEQGAAYGKEFVDYAKDELIKRGESLPLDPQLQQQVAAMNDADLRHLVEKDWPNFHLEVMEIARAEYLKRGFANTTADAPSVPNQTAAISTKYPALKTLSQLYNVVAWFTMIGSGIGLLYLTDEYGYSHPLVGLFFMSCWISLLLFSVSELIKVVVDIEHNTRKS